MTLNPWLIIALIVAALALVGGGYAKGHHDEHLACEARVAAMVKASQDAKDAEAKKAHDAAADLEKDNADANAESKTREIIVTKLVDRPVYRSTCFDPDGLSVANAALAGARAAAAQPDKPVP